MIRTLKFLLQKEFLQIFRNKQILISILVGPAIQLLILPLAANYEVKNISVAFVDNDHSSYSQLLTGKILSSGYFKSAGYSPSYKSAYRLVEDDKADLVLEIPQGFERNLIREKQQKVFLAVNAINGIKAGLGGAYLGNIINDFNSDVRLKWAEPGRFSPAPAIEITSSDWFNPRMSYYILMVPGFIVQLLTSVGIFMAAFNIVKEKELGTIEQINVTPIKKSYFILGKIIPFWILGFVVFSIGLIIGRFIYGIVPLGNIALLYGFLAIYQIALLGFGLLISTFAETHQQAVSIAYFFVMIFIFLSGLYTPIDSMPAWAKAIAFINPISHFIDVVRMVLIKGSQFHDIEYHLWVVTALAMVFNALAIWNYRKTT